MAESVTESIFQQLSVGDRRALAKAITLVESSRTDDQIKSRELLVKAIPLSGNSIRIGISGVPGVGKSTFIEALGFQLAESGEKVAVLTVDPSSPFTGGSILGDKTRMERLSSHPNAFIRPSPTGGNLGGVARKTRECMYLCEAAGYKIILVETVGVGQSEYEVASMCDLFLLLLLPGAGDALQGIKRGILELADLMVVNKADGDNKIRAEAAQKDLQSALMYINKQNGDVPEVMMCSALESIGIQEIWKKLNSLVQQTKESGRFKEKRETQMGDWLRRTVEQTVLQNFWNVDGREEKFIQVSADLKKGQISISEAIQRLVVR